jgi:DNA invertase Pin-like site-specific DNA recombinase
MDSTGSSELSDGQTKSQRIRAGQDRARAEGKTIGRPRVIVPRELVAELRQSGHSWAEIARKTGAGVGTVRRVYCDVIGAAQPCQKSEVAAL